MENNHDSFDSFLETDEDAVGWITTFADLMTLLLVFFVLLYSISSFNLDKFATAFERMNIPVERIASPSGMPPFLEIPDLLDTGISIEELTGLRHLPDTIHEELIQLIDSYDLGEAVDIQMVDGKIIFLVQGTLLFHSGSAELNKKAIPVLEELSDIVKAYPRYQLNIKGHTDSVPISTPQFPSNWELSAIRATTVLRQMIQKGMSPERLTATGYGESMPLVPNTTEENRSLNRRVEFVLEKKTR